MQNWTLSNKWVLLLCAFILALPAKPAAAEATAQLEEMVVRSSKIEKKVEHLTDSVTVITEEEIDLKNYTDFTEILRMTPSVEFKQNGGPGQYNYPKIRGYGSGHFMTVLDGMKIDESLGGGIGNLFGQLDPRLISRTEILRGPQATLYGSNTTAGVFAITTKGGLPGTNVNLGAEYGSLNWKKGYTSLRGTQGNFGYGLNFAYTDSDGVHDYNYYENISPHAKLSWMTDTFEAEATLFYMQSEFNAAELDESYAANQSRATWWAFQTPDPNNYNRYDQFLSTLNLRHQINSQLRHKLSAGWFNKESESVDEDDGLLGYHPAPFDNFSFGGNNYNKGQAVPIFDNGNGVPYHTRNKNFQTDYNIIWEKDINKLLLGYEYLYQSGKKWGRYGEMKSNIDNHSFYLTDNLLLLDEALVLTGGMRYDDHETYGEEITYKIGGAYTYRPFGSTLFANYGTSFRAPTFFNLFDPTYGNPNVQPEEGWTLEGGLRQDILDGRFNFELTYWYSELDDVIIYDWAKPRYYVGGVGSYDNRDEARTKGIEIAFGYTLSKRWQLGGNYTYTESRSWKDGVEFRTVQIARNKGNLSLTYDADRYSLTATGYYSGPRLRWNGDVEMDEYFRVDVSGNYRIWDGLTAYFRIENLFDETIEEGLGFEEPGIYVIAGLEWKWSR